MKRIEPEKAPEVFRRLDLKPATGVFVGDVAEHECCILTALYCDAKGCTDATACLADVRELANTGGSAMDLVAASLGVTRDYADGMVWGWDHLSSSDCDPEDPDSFAMGTHDGIAAHQAVLWAGMPFQFYCEDDDDLCDDDNDDDLDDSDDDDLDD